MEVIGAASQDRMDGWFAEQNPRTYCGAFFAPAANKKKAGLSLLGQVSLILDDFFCIDVGSADDLYHIHPWASGRSQIALRTDGLPLSNETSAHSKDG